MWDTLQTLDPVRWLSILIKAAAYATCLVAMGSVLAEWLLRVTDPKARRSLRRLAIWAAPLAAVFTVLRVPVRASFLMGGGWAGAVDPMLLGLVVDSPLGLSVAWRLAGLTLILALLWPARHAVWVALAGVALVALSFALRGHTTAEPRLVLGGLIVLHILCLAFWVGGFAPLMQAAAHRQPHEAGALAERFGRWALAAVALLGAAGLAMLWQFDALHPSALTTGYGQFFAVKLALFAAILALAALNKLRLTPALKAGEPKAAGALRRSIRWEAVLILAVLWVSAAVTTVSAPP